MRALPLLIAALAVLLAPCRAQQRRDITVAAARLLDTSWASDVTGLAIPKGNQDGTLLGFSAELSLLCYSPWFPAPSWRLFRHLTLVDTPSIWYLPLAYQMGDWAPEAGDTLICEAWECDDGCDPANPALLPDPALDDYVGQAIVTMAAFRTGNLVQFDFYRGSTVTANMQLECIECAALNLMGWTNPYKYPTMQPVNGSFAAGVPFNPSPLPSPSPVAPSPIPVSSPAAASPSPVPASPSPSPSPASPSPAPSAPVAPSPSPSPSASPQPSASASPPPAPYVQSFNGPTESPGLASPEPSEQPVEPSPAPAPDTDQTRVPVAVQPPPPQPVDPFIQPPVQEEEQPASKGSSTILIAVLAAVGALVAAILIATACVCIRRRRQAVQPAAPAAASEEGPVLKIRVQKPEHAEAAMRYARAPAAHVITPWRPAVVG